MVLFEVAELLGIAAVATVAIWKGSDILEGAAKALSAHYGLPPVVQGAVVVAIGSSFPELVSVVLATAPPPIGAGEFDLGVSAIVGSAIFNLLVIPAASGILGDEVSSSRNVVYKEAQFYMVAVSAVIITFALAVIYYPAPGERLVGSVTRPLAAMPIVLYGVYVFTQYQDTTEFDAPDVDDVAVAKQWGLLALSLAIIAVAVEGLVHSATGFGDLFDTPSFLWGLTVIAAGTSLPDTLVSVRAARRDEGVTSLANVLGSNIFDLLVAVPAGIMLAGASPINFGVAVPMMGFLTLATVVVFAFLRTDLVLSIPESYALLLLYAGFILWMTLETFGVLGYIPAA